MAEPLAAPRWSDHLHSVRVRITLVATVVTGVAVLLAGLWLVRSVDRTLTSRSESSAEARAHEIGERLAAGQSPEDVDLGGPGQAVVILRDGRPVAATDPSLARLYTIDPAGNVVPILPGISIGGVPTDSLIVAGQRVDSAGRRFDVLAATPIDSVRRSVDAVRDGLFATLPLLVVSVAILAWYLSGRALRPVEAIRTEVEAISGSTLDRRVPTPRGTDEVARLAHTMNDMLDRLEDASLRQQRFVADASHELRSPVAAIRTELEVAQLTAGPEEWPEVAERLLAEEGRLEAVIADLLLLASLDEGAAGSEAVPVDLAELAQEEARRHPPVRAGVVVEVDAGAPVVVHGSRTQLHRALGNLLDNAVRHTRGAVRVVVLARDGRARMIVDDDGPGIAEADRERAFERFTRLDDHRARDGAAGGSGLGLSLVRRIAQLHGGSATIETAPLGGARVVLDLPLHEA